MKSKTIEVRRGNVAVKINVTEGIKNGRKYTAYIVNENRDGRRRQHSFADQDAARHKAAAIAEAVAAGKSEVLRWEDELLLELRKALEAIEPTGVSILPASLIFAQAVNILGG